MGDEDTKQSSLARLPQSQEEDQAAHAAATGGSTSSPRTALEAANVSGESGADMYKRYAQDAAKGGRAALPNDKQDFAVSNSEAQRGAAAHGATQETPKMKAEAEQEEEQLAAILEAQIAAAEAQLLALRSTPPKQVASPEAAIMPTEAVLEAAIAAEELALEEEAARMRRVALEEAERQLKQQAEREAVEALAAGEAEAEAEAEAAEYVLGRQDAWRKIEEDVITKHQTGPEVQAATESTEAVQQESWQESPEQEAMHQAALDAISRREEVMNAQLHKQLVNEAEARQQRAADRDQRIRAAQSKLQVGARTEAPESVSAEAKSWAEAKLEVAAKAAAAEAEMSLERHSKLEAAARAKLEAWDIAEANSNAEMVGSEAPATVDSLGVPLSGTALSDTGDKNGRTTPGQRVLDSLAEQRIEEANILVRVMEQKAVDALHESERMAREAAQAAQTASEVAAMAAATKETALAEIARLRQVDDGCGADVDQPQGTPPSIVGPRSSQEIVCERYTNTQDVATVDPQHRSPPETSESYDRSRSRLMELTAEREERERVRNASASNSPESGADLGKTYTYQSHSSPGIQKAEEYLAKAARGDSFIDDIKAKALEALDRELKPHTTMIDKADPLPVTTASDPAITSHQSGPGSSLVERVAATVPSPTESQEPTQLDSTTAPELVKDNCKQIAIEALQGNVEEGTPHVIAVANTAVSLLHHSKQLHDACAELATSLRDDSQPTPNDQQLVVTPGMAIISEQQNHRVAADDAILPPGQRSAERLLMNLCLLIACII